MACYLKFTTAYTDGTTRNLQVGPIDVTSVSPTTLKQKIINFNDDAQRQATFPTFDNAFVADSGAPFSSIKAAEIISTTREYYF